MGDGVLVAQETEFSGNSADRGGAICVERTGRMRLYSVTFKGNAATTLTDAGGGTLTSIDAKRISKILSGRSLF